MEESKTDTSLAKEDYLESMTNACSSSNELSTGVGNHLIWSHSGFTFLRVINEMKKSVRDVLSIILFGHSQ